MQILGEIINKHMTVVCEKVVSRCCSISSGPCLHLTQCAATEAFPSRAPSDLTRTWIAPHVVLGVAESFTPFEYFTTEQDHAVRYCVWRYRETSFAFSLNSLQCIAQVHFANIVISVRA